LASVVVCSGATVVVNVTLEREDEIAGPILAPFFPQVSQFCSRCSQKRLQLLLFDARLMASFSRTSWISQHQKGYTNLDFTEARDDGVAVASAGPYASYLRLALSRQTTPAPHHSIFLQARCSS